MHACVHARMHACMNAFICTFRNGSKTGNVVQLAQHAYVGPDLPAILDEVHIMQNIGASTLWLATSGYQRQGVLVFDVAVEICWTDKTDW